MIWSTFGESLPAAVGIAISPLPVVLVILMLVSARAKVNGPAFLVGWIVGVSIVVTAAFLLADAADAATDSTTADTVDWMQLVVGVLFFALAARQWRKRPQPGTEPATPKLFSTVDSMNALSALGLGVAACIANPKNLPLGISAGATMAASGIHGSDAVWAIVLFVIVASATVGVPVAVFFVMGSRAEAVLSAWKSWLTLNNATVMMVLFAVLGARSLGTGLGVLA